MYPICICEVLSETLRTAKALFLHVILVLQVDRVCSDSKEVSETLEKEVAALREQAATAAAALAAVNAELLTAQREAMDASDAAAADTERLQDEMGELVDAKDEEIARLRASLERAEAQEQSEVASLQARYLSLHVHPHSAITSCGGELHLQNICTLHLR